MSRDVPGRFSGLAIGVKLGASFLLWDVFGGHKRLQNFRWFAIPGAGDGRAAVRGVARGVKRLVFLGLALDASPPIP